MRIIIPLLRDAWRLARPYFASEEKYRAWLLLAAVVGLTLGLVGMDVVLSFWNRAFYDALQAKDAVAFMALLLTWQMSDGWLLPGFIWVAGAYVLVAVYLRYLTQMLVIGWRTWLTQRFVAAWLSDQVYYRLGLTAAARAGADNPDQRIAEDVRDFVDRTLSLCLDLMSNIVSLSSFIAILWSLSGPLTLWGISVPGYMVWVALLYATLGSVLIHYVGKPLAGLRFRQQKVEADFRFAMMRLRENAEGIALYAGEADERKGLRARFAALIGNWWEIMRRAKLINALAGAYGQAAVVFPVLVAAPRFFAGEIALGGLTQTAGAFGQVQGSMSWFVNSYAELANWRAIVDRLAGFERTMKAARAQKGLTEIYASDGNFALQNATLALPDGRTLADITELMLQRDQSVVVTGRSGSGKSTLFRALAGIWPFASGIIRRPEASSLFLPQRAYLPLGSLRRALTYPDEAAVHADAALVDVLTKVGLPGLVGQLDAEDEWGQRLSGGEQQRLAIARALLQRPEWLFLDEATASLDPESEAMLYALLKRELPGTTIVSIAHRPSVAAWHDRRLIVSQNEAGNGTIAEG
jgi:putative ATP-binding cassette transporter